MSDGWVEKEYARDQMLRLRSLYRRGACGDRPYLQGLFFSEVTAVLAQEQAKQICFGCEERINCLEWALETNEQHGIWGGLNHRERQKAKRRRRITVIPVRERQAV